MSKTVIDTENGSFLGNAVDFEIDMHTGSIQNFLIPQKSRLFRRSPDFTVSWSKIKKIGAEVILAEAENEHSSDFQAFQP